MTENGRPAEAITFDVDGRRLVLRAIDDDVEDEWTALRQRVREPNEPIRLMKGNHGQDQDAGADRDAA